MIDNTDIKDLKGKWYAVRVHMGFEFSVEKILNQTIESIKLQDKVFKILVPTEKQIKINKGKRTEKNERIYPGFVLLNMILDDKTWYLINNTEHVNGFVGSRTQAETISDEEMEKIFSRMNKDTTKLAIELSIGDLVQIVNGPFSNLTGKVNEIDQIKGNITVSVPMFGRETPVKLHLFQIKKI